MDGKLRNMTSIYITKADKMLLLFRQGSKVVNDVWVGSAGGHFEDSELNDARACVFYYFFAELNNDVDECLVSNEGICKWFAYSELSTLEMPYTAKYVIEHYLDVGRKTDDIYGGVADGETVVFTKMPEF